MASLLLATGILSYESIKKSRAKRAAKKTSFNDARFSELERDNAARIARLQTETCFCQSSDWRGGGCDTHGYVPAAGEVGGPPAYTEEEVGGEGARGERRVPRESYPDYRYRRGVEDGTLADIDSGGPRSRGWMPEEEVRRINEERRKRMRTGGLTNWVLRRKGKGKGKGGGGDDVVR